MKRISYFSYKGGSGRSSLVYNTIAPLAERLGADRRHPLIVLDMDLDSAGLTFLFGENVENFRKATDNEYKFAQREITYVQDIFADNIPDKIFNAYSKPDLWTHALFRSLVPIGDYYGLDKEAILFMPVNTNVGQKKDVEADGTYNMHTEHLDSVVDIFDSYDCCGLIFDCPTGRQQTARASLANSSEIVTVMRITTQFRKGTYAHLDWFDRISSGRTLYIVPNAVPRDNIVLDTTPFDYDLVKDEIRSEVKRVVQNNECNIELLKGEFFGVPEVVRFKFREEILSNRPELSPDEELAVKAYRKLAEELTK